jgi:hypothetical protein
MAFDVDNPWPFIESRLTAGKRVTKAEVADALRSHPEPPSRVCEWIADRLEGKSTGLGRPKNDASDALQRHLHHPTKLAVRHYYKLVDDGHSTSEAKQIVRKEFPRLRHDNNSDPLSDGIRKGRKWAEEFPPRK